MKPGRNLFVTSGVLTFMLAGTAMAEPMSAAEIKKLVPGNYSLSVADSVKASARLKRGGGLFVSTDRGERDSGHWSIAGNKMCVVFKHLLDHKTHCSALTYDNGMIRGDGFTARRN